MATKLNIFLQFLIVVCIVIILLLMLASVCHAEVYILTGADSTDKVFDTYIVGGQHPSFKLKNYGGAGVMTAAWQYSGNPFYKYPLINFDISGCPALVSEIDTAILWGIAYDMRSSFILNERDTVGYDSISVEINQVFVQWGEGVGWDNDNATDGECSYIDSLFVIAAGREAWNSEGCNGLGTDINATPTGWQHLELDPSVGNYVDTLYMDVTDDVKDMLADPVHPNEYAGWKITPVGFNQDATHVSSYVDFFTKESSEIHDPNKWKLLIYYTPAVVATRRIKILKGANQ